MKTKGRSGRQTRLGPQVRCDVCMRKQKKQSALLALEPKKGCQVDVALQMYFKGRDGLKCSDRETVQQDEGNRRGTEEGSGYLFVKEKVSGFVR